MSPESAQATLLPAEMPQNVAPLATTTPMMLLSMAVSHGAGIDTIERLVALQEHMASRDAEQAFNAAMSRAQAAMGRVSADATNPQTKSKYATYAAIDKQLRPIYSSEGFALSFDTAESTGETLEVLCYVSHSAGHTRTYRVTMPSDGKGAKGGDVMTKTHAAGAAMSYGMRYLLKMIFNVAVGEDDVDGNKIPAQPHALTMPEAEFQAHMKKIKEAATSDLLKDAYHAAYAATPGRDNATQKALIEAKNARYRELNPKEQK